MTLANKYLTSICHTQFERLRGPEAGAGAGCRCALSIDYSSSARLYPGKSVTVHVKHVMKQHSSCERKEEARKPNFNMRRRHVAPTAQRRRWRWFCLPLLLVLAGPLVLFWQHNELEAARVHHHSEAPTASVFIDAESLLPPPSPPQQERLNFVDGESVGGPSTARVCVVMPVRAHSLVKAVRNVRSWATERGFPCKASKASVNGTGPSQVDLCFFHSQSFSSARDVRLAEDLNRALDEPVSQGVHGTMSTPRACFGAVRFLAARIPLSVDVYTIYPTHNFTGPNTHFLSTFAALERVSKGLGLARYAHFQILETDTYAFRPAWADALASVAKSRRKEWVLGSRSMCLRPTEVEHINGNAMYALERTFQRELRRELTKRLDSWAFDVLIGHWLMKKHPARIRESRHILSISTFQRNRSCCELVRSMVAQAEVATAAEASLADAHASSWPGLFLLHTGNIGKLRDSAVPPSMRRLGLSLQDLFVPRSDEPCSLDSSLPLHLRTCHTLTQLWRARLKGQGDCRPVAKSSLLLPVVWVPGLEVGGRAAPRRHAVRMLRALVRTYHLSLSSVGGGTRRDATHAAVEEALSTVAGFVEDGEMGQRLDASADVDDPLHGAAGAAQVLVGARLPELLASLAHREGSFQIVAMLQPPSASLWQAYQADRAKARGRAPPELEKWLAKKPSNPMVTALGTCQTAANEEDKSVKDATASLDDDGAGDAKRAGADDNADATSDEIHALETAKTVMQERALSIVLTQNTTQRSVDMLGRFFGWRRRRHRQSSGENELHGRAEVSDDADVLEAAPPANAAAPIKEKLSLDARLYEFAVRLADEQYRSVVWEEEESGAAAASDVCLAAEEAGEKAASRRVPPTPLSLGATASFTWDGDGYRVFELTVPPREKPKAVTLMLRGKSVIGSSPFTVNIFISHKTTQPSFAERSFRYMYESRPPHRHSGKFVLSLDRLQAACVEEAEMASHEKEAGAACLATRSLKLWIAFKCRSVAVSQLTLVATQGQGKSQH